MIPDFPEFRAVDVDVRAAVEAHTARFPPSSDFNFTSLWTWDTTSRRMLSALNGNLVVLFTDYSSDAPFLSFLGVERPDHTALTLLRYAREAGIEPVLRLVPETSATGLMQSPFMVVTEDRDNFDYVYALSDLVTFPGPAFVQRRYKAGRFRREHPTAHVTLLDLHQPEVQGQVLDVVRTWESNKIEDGKTYDLCHEEQAIRRLLATVTHHPVVLTGVVLDSELIGFSIDEVLPSDYAITHFWKADARFNGVFDFLKQEKSRHLQTLGASHLNFEQDLGVESMRRSKTSFRPTGFLKKYSVRLA